MRTLHDFFQRRAPAPDPAPPSDRRVAAAPQLPPDARDEHGDGDADGRDDSASPPVSPPAAGDDSAGGGDPASQPEAPRKRWAELSATEREAHWAEQRPRQRRRRRRPLPPAPSSQQGAGGSFRSTRANELLGQPVEAWRRVYRRSWAAPMSLALENRDQIEPRGSSWGGEAARVARQNGVRDVVVDMQFDQVGALLAAACRDGRVQVHDFDEFATRLTTLGDVAAEAEPAAAAAAAAQASHLPPRCEDTTVLTLVAPRQVGAGVAWDTATESHLWTWYHSSNAVHLYDIERCRPDAPTRVYKPSASTAAASSELSTGISSAQFATAGGSAILSTVFAVGGRGGTVFFYDKRSKTVPIYSIEGRYGGVHSMQLSVDGQLLLFSTSGGRQSNPMLLGYDVRAICSHSAVGRESKRVLGEKQGARSCLLSLPIDASFRAPRPPRAGADGDIIWVKDASGRQVSKIKAASTATAIEWTYGDRLAERPAVVPATTIALSPCGASQLAYQLEDGSVGQLDLAQLCSSWRRGVDERGGPPHGRAFAGSGLSAAVATVAGATRHGSGLSSALPFTQLPMPAQRRFPAGFTSPGGASAAANGDGAQRSCPTTPVFYHDTHPALVGSGGGSLSLHDFSSHTKPCVPNDLDCDETFSDAAEAARAVRRATHPLARVALGHVARPSAVAFHPAGDTLVIGGEKNTIFVRQVRVPIYIFIVWLWTVYLWNGTTTLQCGARTARILPHPHCSRLKRRTDRRTHDPDLTDATTCFPFSRACACCAHVRIL
jgi:hypothetical protein